MSSKPTAVLFISCPDQRGLVAQIAEFVFRNNGNIIHSDHHTDVETGLFLMRVEWELEGMRISREEIGDAFAPLAKSLKMRWGIHFSDRLQRIAILVSRYNHCLYDLLLRVSSGELRGEMALIISNHDDLRPVAERFGIPYHVFPVTRENPERSGGAGPLHAGVGPEFCGPLSQPDHQYPPFVSPCVCWFPALPSS